jgi:hypothetical protein
MKLECRTFLSGAAARAIAFFLLALVSLLPFAACGGNFYTNVSPANVPWPGGIVPYDFTNTLTSAQTNTYLNGLREWQLAANIQFVPHTTQTHWVLFTYNTNWIDNVSSSTNPQVVTVSSLSRAQVCHEMGHSFGFTHENIRPDATNFIAVITNHISNESSNIFFFTIDPGSVTNGNYDYESVMHLGWDFASTNPGVAPTQQPKPPNFPRNQYRMGNYCLSPGDRAALAYLYGAPAVPLSNTVTNTADYGPGSLRAAIYYATDHPGSTVSFNIPTSDPGYSNGVFNIHLTGQLPTLVANGMVIDGSTQPGFTSKPLIVVDASQIIPETSTSDTVLVYSSGNQLKDISFSGFNWNGLTLEYADATNNTIAGCWLGVDFSGTNAAPNAYQGILVAAGASRNTFGGTNALARNVISGNSQYGIFITDSNTMGNVVLGNDIGTAANGTNALANGYSGVFIGNGSSGNIIGGTNSGARNVLSGNSQYGIFITDSNTTGNVVLGNYIGTATNGLTAVPNGLSGVFIGNGTSGNIIGGTNALARNVLSGNSQSGLIMTSNTTGNVVLGNYIGTDASGSNAVANEESGVTVGGGAGGNTFGGTNSGARNVISGNSPYGIFLTNTTGNVISGNYFGVNAGGQTALANSAGGLLLTSGALSNIIGGTVTGARNVISGNTTAGIFLAGTTRGNLIDGNYIGTDTTGTNAVPNTLAGIYAPYPGGPSGNIIGGTTAATRNVISGNTSYNVYFAGPGTGGNLVEGNYIGVTPDGAHKVGSTFAGVIIFAGATNNTIGGASAGAGNVISGSSGYGVYISDAGTSGNVVQGNIIGADATGTNTLGNGYHNVIIQLGATNNIIGGTNAGAGNVIAFSPGAGVLLLNANTTNNTIRGNSIFSNGFLGINFSNTTVAVNHSGFLAGPNNMQNFPVITNAFGYASSTIILGKFNSLAGQSYSIDLYRNTAPDISGYGEGQFYLGTISVTTDGSGNAAFAYTNTAGNFSGQYISSTATDSAGDTSEFDADVLASNAPAPSSQFAAPYNWRTNGFIFNLTFATNFSYRIQATTNLGTNPITWIDLTNFTPTIPSLTFTDRTATNFGVRFYRVISP